MWMNAWYGHVWGQWWMLPGFLLPGFPENTRFEFIILLFVSAGGPLSCWVAAFVCSPVSFCLKLLQFVFWPSCLCLFLFWIKVYSMDVCKCACLYEGGGSHGGLWKIFWSKIGVLQQVKHDSLNTELERERESHRESDCRNLWMYHVVPSLLMTSNGATTWLLK